ncbi:hypothetical protein DM01DRAFT_1319866 [Hesseltinella vesiculosa]|uniref:Cyclin N-terminal domain-containing protein n=1 Tax=Hesseltinella vesiculosa TaxID=101127 RepID=A0A1X2GLG0_9FUNG|nr:hypothetical protein DM01DRAFT_1319866 [Hesseltinella vesiculosa]
MMMPCAQPYTLFPAKPVFAPSFYYPNKDTCWLPSQEAASSLLDLSPGSPVAPSLSDFSATIVYLMWHARNHAKTRPSFASPAFKRFCLQVLNATQLTESAVYLALGYIANLLRANPSIEGAEGSEYRLFIVALMLANKFLDDNTFTNKTWSEVSGMNIQDLNIMESEFLEALDYSLFVRDQDYTQWKRSLDSCRQQLRLDLPFHHHQALLQKLGVASPNPITDDFAKPASPASAVFDGYYSSDSDASQHGDDDDDTVDDLFQLMQREQSLRQAEDQKQWPPVNATRLPMESQPQYHLHALQQQQQHQQRYRRSFPRYYQQKQQELAIPPVMQTGSGYRFAPSCGRYSDRYADSFYSHGFHPYQRQSNIVPPPGLRTTNYLI